MKQIKPRRGYQCWLVDNASRASLLHSFPPLFEKVVCHHVTYRYNVLSTDALPEAADIKVIGYAANDKIEALVVSVNGTEKRQDDKTYHITLSLDPEQAKPVDSNKLIEFGWSRLDSPISINTTPSFQ